MRTYPLSQSQLGVFLEIMQHPQMTQYNLGYMSSLPKSIDVDRLVQALKTIYATRPEFRIRFQMEGEEPRQRVDDTRELPIVRLSMSESECEDFLKEALKPFDLFNDVLCRFYLIETPDKIVFLGEFSHLVSDGMSIALILAKEYLPLAYAGMPLPEQSYGLLSWAEDEEATFHTAAYEKDREYYRQHFQDCEALSLAEPVSDPLGKYIRSDLYLPISEIADWCKQYDTAPNLLMMAAFAYTLSVVGREENFVFTTVNHGRMQRKVREAFGMFVRTVPVRATVSPDTKVIDFVKSFRAELMSTIRHGNYPFIHFCHDLQMRPGINFNFYGGEIIEDMRLDENSYSSSLLDPDTTCSDLTFSVIERDGQYDLRADSSDRLYSPSFLQTMVQAVKTVTYNMMLQPESTLSSLSLVDDDEQNSLILLGTGEKRDYDTTKTLIDLFMEQAEKTPDSIAVMDVDSQYTYQELDIESNLLAHLLIKEGIEPGDHVCVELPRRKEFLLTVLGIMKAGA